MNDQKQCYFCTSNIKIVNYKDPEMLKKFLGAQAKILPRKQTDLCAKHQRSLAQAIKRARFLALLPYIAQ
ncbi:MAG: 30S ribosomal protein S18 [Candidatus Niyogibacteria bacterium]|nr:30S ribosomal protein S18 [Candidatus Niyogibacteria bacterium]